MAANTAHAAKTFTTTNGSADSCTLTEFGPVVQIANHSSAGVPIYATIGVTAAATTTPTSEGDNCFVVLPGQTLDLPYPPVGAGFSVCVKTIAAAAQKCTIQVLTTRRT